QVERLLAGGIPVDDSAGREMEIPVCYGGEGHSYIGVHDARLDLPRRATPRTAVPAGSVAIANRQTVIYPARLPGGWNIIGATPLNLFDPGREPAALLQPGDRIRFVPIDAAEFDRLREAQ
ncbi:5-oxoprolinase subunit B family protein, partial [Bordetella pertussis]|uniref:5-oxoprolinase subunit B family protein n=1 Tax=Bordetella pertussis TaxID=520 RepID=UPI000AAC57AF